MSQVELILVNDTDECTIYTIQYKCVQAFFAVLYNINVKAPLSI